MGPKKNPIGSEKISWVSSNGGDGFLINDIFCIVLVRVWHTSIVGMGLGLYQLGSGLEFDWETGRVKSIIRSVFCTLFILTGIEFVGVTQLMRSQVPDRRPLYFRGFESHRVHYFGNLSKM